MGDIVFDLDVQLHRKEGRGSREERREQRKAQHNKPKQPLEKKGLSKLHCCFTLPLNCLTVNITVPLQ